MGGSKGEEDGCRGGNEGKREGGKRVERMEEWREEDGEE